MWVAMGVTPSAIATALLLLLHLLLPARRRISAYRIKGSDDEGRPFVPYERGFVQNVQDPAASVANRGTRVNQGYPSSSARLGGGDGAGANRLFSCPNMVGPFFHDDDDDDDFEGAAAYYFCTGDKNGYCDRRSGTCFCNEGYAGESCEDCDYATHFELGGMCRPKRTCPNDCSRGAGGRCNYLTGACECSDHRTGDDCSVPRCSLFHRFCTRCNDGGCLECEEGWSVVRGGSPPSSRCEPCWRFDPRCRDCSADACTSCVDLLLLSIHRSGRRPQDPPLPYDEERRELSVTVPFGSQQDDAFYDAEHYFLVDDPALVPLNESAVECHQGLNFDGSITCTPYNLTSHKICGNHGTITFESPEYAVREDEKQIRLTLQRSGGGVGEVAVSYSIYPMTAGYKDVTSTAYYTTNQTIIFRPGQVRASFLVTINDDRIMETNNTFSVHLSKPTGGGRIGTQSRTIVTIIDDDEHRTCSDKSFLGHGSRDLGSVEAGTPHKLNVIAKKCNGIVQTIGGDVMQVEARMVRDETIPRRFDAPVTVGSCHDSDDGTYACVVTATMSGSYELDVYQLVPGGLKGYYYTDNYLSDERLNIIRTDAVVNFTWQEGAITTFGRDYVSVRWEGYVMPSFSEPYTFWVDADDHARLWVDGILLIDSWTFPSTSTMLHAEHDLTATKAHEVIMEYREIVGNATARLLWSSTSTGITAIPSSALFYKEPVEDSPFSFRVTPAGPSALVTHAYGEGLYQGIAGKTHEFTIDDRDSWGNPRRQLMKDVIFDYTKFQGIAEIIDYDGTELGNSLIPVIISYNATTMKYDSVWTPVRSGMYQLNVTLLRKDGTRNHIFGSPFLVKTNPGATFASESIAEGGHGNCLPSFTSPCPGVYHGMAGQESSFVIRAFDLNRNKRDVGGDDWEVVLSTKSKYTIGRIDDLSDGTYITAVAPIISGPNMLSITLNGSPIKGSPFRMDVIHGHVVGTSSYVVDEANVMRMTAMTENSFLIQAVDEFGNTAIYCDEQPFTTTLVVEGKDVDSEKTLVRYVGAGLYDISVTMLRSGNRHVNIRINGSDIKGSPFTITVIPGTFFASSSSASGLGLSRAIAGDEAHFIIQSKDLGGNNKIDNEARFDVYLSLIDSDNLSVLLGSLEYVGNGQHLVKYTCFFSGIYALVVQDKAGENIAGSPFRVAVGPAAMSGPRSLVVGQGLVSGVAGEVAEVRVLGRDKYDNPVNHAVEMIEMNMMLMSHHQSDCDASHDPVGKRTIKQLARDSGGGVFVLDYTPVLSGAYELGLTTFSPGGLKGSYYSAQDLLPDFLVATLLDKEIEKNFEDDPIVTMIGTASHFGIVWNGKLAADHTETYSITIHCNDGGHASFAIDGKFIPWHSCDPLISMSISMRADKAVDFSLRYKSLEGTSAFVNLMWGSPSVPMEIIPSRNLFHQVQVGEATMHRIQITPNKIYPPQSNAVGASRIAISGLEHEFMVECRDSLGNLMLTGGTRVEVKIHHQNGFNFHPTIFDNNNGTYSVKYNPGATGVYFLSVNVFGSPIKGSPFVLNVQPGETEPQESTLLSVEGGIEGVTGRELVLEFQAMDINRNKRHRGDDEIMAVMTPFFVAGHQETLYCNSKYYTDGRYAITCPAAIQSGSFLLDVDLLVDSATKPIKSSPFHITIFPGHAIPETTQVVPGGSAGQTFSQTTVKFTSKARQWATFVVRSHDRFKNPLNAGGNQFVARVHGNIDMASSEKRVEVIDQGNGNFILAYKMSHPSTYNIDVSMVTGAGLVGKYYKNETSFKNDTPDFAVASEQISFNNRRLNDNRLFSYARWMGYISFPHTTSFQIEIIGIEGKCKLLIGDEVVIDTNEDSSIGRFRAYEHVLYEMIIEYSMDINRLMLQLLWSSQQNRREVIPMQHLFSSLVPIRGSPFHLTVTE